MMRGTFANVRIKNLMLPPKADGSRVEGGITIMQPSGEELPIYDAAMKYIAAGTPTVVFGGEEYGSGSSHWGPGHATSCVKAVCVRSFERIPARTSRHGLAAAAVQGTDSAASIGSR